jgi:glycosyltransferase involved in cell wall biosynthesis
MFGHSARAVDISVLTPTWNRGPLLQRVFEGLAAQTDPAFEWIVADDGSTDGTPEIVAGFAAIAPFPITYLRAGARVGKSRMDNAAVREARGGLIVWCDSDDHFVPTTIATLKATWQSIPVAERSDFVGVTALAATAEGVIVDPMPGVAQCDIGWNDMTEGHGINTDMVYMIRADVLKRHPFPEVDLVIPESVVWSRIGDMKARYIAQVVKMVEYRTANAISFSGSMSYNRGRAYALALTDRHLRHYPKPFRTRWWRLTTFIRYAIHGELSMRNSRLLWADNPAAAYFWSTYPFAILLALRDRLRGKVIRSHRLFDDNRTVTITPHRLDRTDG